MTMKTRWTCVPSSFFARLWKSGKPVYGFADKAIELRSCAFEPCLLGRVDPKLKDLVRLCVGSLLCPDDASLDVW